MYSIGIHNTTAILYCNRKEVESVTGDSKAIEKFINDKKVEFPNIEVYGNYALRTLKEKEGVQDEKWTGCNEHCNH